MKRKKKAAFNLSDSSKQYSGEHWSPQSNSKAPVDKFGTVMRSRYALFRKTIQESLDAQSSDVNHSWPGDATSSDSWRFCIAWFSNCYGNEHHRLQNRAILLQCVDRPLRARSHCIKIVRFSIERFRRIVCITVTLLFWVSLVGDSASGVAGYITMSTGFFLVLWRRCLPFGVSLTVCQFVFCAHWGCQNIHSWRKTILLLSKLRLDLSGILELAVPDCLELSEN